MDRTELLASLQRAWAPWRSAHGFDVIVPHVALLPGEAVFHLAHKTPWGSYVTIQTANSFPEGWTIGLNVGVQVAAIEQVCNSVRNADERLHAPTLRRNTLPIAGQFDITSEQHITNWVAFASSEIEKTGFTFFNQFLTVVDVERFLNADENPDASRNGIESDVRLVKGALLAELVQHPRSNHLIEINREALVKDYPDWPPVFDDALSNLRSKRPDYIEAAVVPFVAITPTPASPTPSERIVNVVGFDAMGEPEIRVQRGGPITIVFNFMPPFVGEEPSTDPAFDDFAAALTTALGVDVVRDDREVFIIEHPKRGTASKAKRFLESYWPGPVKDSA
jgi:hypothetical protein